MIQQLSMMTMTIILMIEKYTYTKLNYAVT